MNTEFAFGVYLSEKCGHLEVRGFMLSKTEELLQKNAVQDTLDDLTSSCVSKLQCRNFKTYIERIKNSRLVNSRVSI